jgi:probable rRNA maturation factor
MMWRAAWERRAKRRLPKRPNVLLNRQRRVRFRRAEVAAFLARLEADVAGREIGVAVVSDAVIRRYNRRYRKINKATDVLSFEPDDLVISAEAARRQARRLGHSVEEEMKVLALHGTLHLMGHDHERDRGEMARLERRWRRRLGLPVALTERCEAGQKRPTRR